MGLACFCAFLGRHASPLGRLGTAAAAHPFVNLTPPVSTPFFRRKQKTMLFRANYPL